MIMTGGSAARKRASRTGRSVTLSFAALMGTGLAGFAPFFISSPADAKTPGSTYCYYGTCHRVKTIAETQSLVGSKEIVQASFYDDCKNDTLNPCGLTSSGEAFRPDRADNAASPIYPDGTTLLVWSPSSKQAAVLRVNNAGPYWGGRKLDVSRAAAEALGFKPVGVAELQIHVIDAPSAGEATYERYRKYAAVPGPVGQYNSLEEARLSLAVMRAFDEMPATALTQVADATAALAPQLMQDHLAIDMPEIVVTDAPSVKPARPVMKTAQKRVDAKAKRMASKKKSHYARRSGTRRSTVASRREARGSRYAYQRSATTSRRAARSRVMSRSRVVKREWRGRRPIVTRSRGNRRVAEVMIDRVQLRGLLPGSSLLKNMPADRVRADRPPSGAAPVRGPVQVV